MVISVVIAFCHRWASAVCIVCSHVDGSQGFGCICPNAWDCYGLRYQRPMTELLSLMAVMLEGLDFNLCVVPFLNVCVPNLPQGVKDRECQSVRFLHFTKFLTIHQENCNQIYIINGVL